MEGSHKDSEQSLSDPYHLSNQNPENSDNIPSSIGDVASEAAPALNDSSPTSATAPERSDPYSEQVQNVVTSEIGVQILLNRLKQSVASAKEFALFLQKRSRLEEEHASGLRKISRITHDNLRRPEHRQGSFLASYDEITKIHERMADNGAQFAASLHQMHEDMVEMSTTIERGRKHWKTTGLSAEQRLLDAEIAMRKSKAKYDSLAEDYDRARTGERQATKKFGLKGPKSAAQHEEDLLRKVQAADSDYAAKVQAAYSMRQEHLRKGRPEAVKSLQDLINECDSALSLQMQKFASFNEKLLLHNGMSVSPMKGQPNEPGKSTNSLREAIMDINNEGDLSYYIASHSSQVPPRPAEIKYERHPVLNPTAPHVTSSIPAQRQSETPQTVNSFNSRQGPSGAPGGTPPQQSPSFTQAPAPAVQAQQQQYQQQHERSFSHTGPPPQSTYNNNGSVGRAGNGNSLPHPPSSSFSSGGPPQLQSLPFQTSAPLSQSLQENVPVAPQPQAPQPQQYAQQPGPPQQAYNQQAQQVEHQQPQHQQPQHQQPQHQQQRPSAADPSTLPPLKPVFGMTLEQLFDRDGSAVPMVVYQCIQAVDLYGLELEGIYRLSGTASHVTKIRAMFNNDASKVDFRNPEAFFQDVNSVAGLLKLFFRDLPDPLLTTEHYTAFIEAARVDDDILRRDSMHAIINALPDPNYATLRAITLHLNRVTDAAAANRMNASNLAIVWGPTLMGAGTGGNIQDAGWQVKVVQTILENCYQIFDDD